MAARAKAGEARPTAPDSRRRVALPVAVCRPDPPGDRSLARASSPRAAKSPTLAPARRGPAEGPRPVGAESPWPAARLVPRRAWASARAPAKVAAEAQKTGASAKASCASRRVCRSCSAERLLPQSLLPTPRRDWRATTLPSPHAKRASRCARRHYGAEPAVLARCLTAARRRLRASSIVRLPRDRPIRTPRTRVRDYARICHAHSEKVSSGGSRRVGDGHAADDFVTCSA
jgi:hypothetical protein